MSKHLGNMLAPIPLMDAHGADALRWFMACSGSPWSPRRVGPGPLDEITRKLLMTYWNTASFFSLYAAQVRWEPENARPVRERPILDRWILGRLHALVGEVTERLETYDTAGAGRLLGEFVDDLSNWYVRRSRPRFWDGDQDALSTLYESLDVLTRLLARSCRSSPRRSGSRWCARAIRAPDSVHLTTWPQADVSLMSTQLADQVRTARALAEVGRAARKASKVKVRQPLARALVGLPGGAAMPQELLDEVADELNVKELVTLDSVGAGAVVDVEVKPNFRVLGQRFGKQTQEVAKAVLAADAQLIVSQLRAGGTAALVIESNSFDSGSVEVTAAELMVSERPRSGWVVESQRGVTIALDTAITEELAAKGVARDTVRLVQQARRTADLNVSDRVHLRIEAPPEALVALKRHQGYIAHETLAIGVEFIANKSDSGVDDFDVQVRKV